MVVVGLLFVTTTLLALLVRGVWLTSTEPLCEYLPEYGGPVRWLAILSFVPASEIKFCLFLIQFWSSYFYLLQLSA